MQQEKYLDRHPQGFLDEFHIRNKIGLKLFCVSYTVPNQAGICFMVHGYGEHLGEPQYKYVAAELNRLGISVYGLENQGFGRSEAKDSMRAYVENFDDFSDDLIQFVEFVIQKKENQNLPVFGFGHSMGADILFQSASKKPQLFNGLIFSAPCLKHHPNEIKPYRILALKLISLLLPNLFIKAVDKHLLTRTKQVQDDTEADPISILDIRTGIALKFKNWTDHLLPLFDTFHVPFLFLQGDADGLTDKTITDLMFEKAPCKDKTYHVYKGAYHDLRKK
eukprot:Sdes_comp18221_c0_seq1m7801